MALIDSLESYWKLEEASGTRVDAEGSNDLADNNTVTGATGIIGNATAYVDANDEFLSIADNASISVGASQNFSWQFWIYPNSFSNNRFIGGKSGGFFNNQEWSIRAQNNGDVRLDIGDGSSSVNNTKLAALTEDAWNHVVFVWDGTNQIIYVNDDGSPKSDANTNGSQDNGDPLSIGQWHDGSSLGFDGRIDEVGFWKKALTSAEVTELYNGGAGLAYPFTVATIPNRIYQTEQAVNRASTY